MAPMEEVGLSLTPSMNKGVNLSMLVDFLLQKTYHDLSILSELLPRKPDIERKIEIIQFATRARQQFIRLLALVKWAASADRVDKCQIISSFLDQQNAYFVDTADTLARIARETLVQARLPNFSLPTAVDVLTTGTFNRLPKCIKERIVPEDPIKPEDKAWALKRLDEVIQSRLVNVKIPLEFTNIRIGDGKVKLKVENEFEVTLTLMGNETNIPWRLLNIEFLIKDFNTGDGKALVHGYQINYIHQIVQSRLMLNEDPLNDMYNAMHYFCLSLQLELLHTQCKRLIAERWGDFVRVDDYVPGQNLTVSYWRTAAHGLQSAGNQFPTMCIRGPRSESGRLLLSHIPELEHRVELLNQSNGIQLATSCLSIEKILYVAVKERAKSKLQRLQAELRKDPFFQNNSSFEEKLPCLSLKPYSECGLNELVILTVDPRTGQILLRIRDVKLGSSNSKQLENIVREDPTQFGKVFHEVRCSMYLERITRSVSMLPVCVHQTLPITNLSTHMLNRISKTRLYLKFTRHPKYCLVVAVEMKEDDPEKSLQTSYYLLSLQLSNDSYANAIHAPATDIKSPMTATSQEHHPYFLSAGTLTRLDVASILALPKQKKASYAVTDLKKRKALSEVELAENSEYCSKKKIKTETSTLESISQDGGVSTFDDTVTRMVTSCCTRIPFINLCNQLSKCKISFDSLTHESKVDTSLQILELPNPPGCLKRTCNSLKERLLSCSVRLCHEIASWKVEYRYAKPAMKCLPNASVGSVEFTHTTSDGENFMSSSKDDRMMVYRILRDWEAMLKIYHHAEKLDDIFNALAAQGIGNFFKVEKFDYQVIDILYGSDLEFKLSIRWISPPTTKFLLEFNEVGKSSELCPHRITAEKLSIEFNQHENLLYILKIIHDTTVPLNALSNLSPRPSQGHLNKRLSVVNNFTIIAHSSTHVKIIYRNQFILDVYFLESSVFVRDGTLYRTDSTKAMRGFTTILQLTSFLQLFVEDTKPGYTTTVTDYPFTPGGAEFDQQSEHYGPASVGSYDISPHQGGRDRSMRSPAVVISSPSQPNQYGQVAAPSPGNPYSIPSPGTFLQPSPASQPLQAAPSPSTWPGSPLVTNSPHHGRINSGPGKQLPSINVSHAPVPMMLPLSGFKHLLSPVEYKTPYMNVPIMISPLEKFFGSILLRSHLIRVVRPDETLKLEKFEHGIVVISGTGTTGLQYSVRLHPLNMASLVLKITPVQGHEGNWTAEELKTLEQFFELKVACPPYTACALTSFTRILGVSARLIKDFIKIMKLEMMTDWTDYKFKVEFCLTVPPGDAPSITNPGTPALALRAKNLIFLKLTELANEENVVTITLVHDPVNNTVQAVEFPPTANVPAEPESWTTRARAAVHSMLNTIRDQVCRKDCPIHVSVMALVKHLNVSVSMQLVNNNR